MAATIKVDLDVDQAQFLAFYNAFSKFSKGLGDTQTKWEGVSEKMQDAASASRELVTVGEKIQDSLEKSRLSLGALKPLTESVARGWASISVTTSRVAANIKDATLSLLRWSGIGGLIGGGVLGLGTLSMDALGSSVTANRSAAMGLGTTYGRRQAFNIAFGRFGDAEGVLGRVSSQQSSADHTALRNLGLTPSEISNMDPSELAARAYQLLGQRAGRVPRGQLKDWLHQNRIDEVFDIGQTRQAISATRSGEMGELQGAFGNNKNRFDLSDQAQRDWARFSMQMEIASGIIKKTFVGSLGRITPSLTQLSKSFTKLVEKLLADGGPVEHGLDALASWLERETKDMDEKKISKWFEDFFSGIESIVTSTGSFVKAIADLLRWFGITPAHASTGGGGGMSTPGGEAMSRGGATNGGGGAPGDGGASGASHAPGGGSVGHMEGGGATPASHSTPVGGSSTPGGARSTPLTHGGGATPKGGIGGSASGWKESIDRAAAAEGIDPRDMYGIVAGERDARHPEKYPIGDHGLSGGPFQLYTGGGLGNKFHHDTGIDPIRPPGTPEEADAQSRYVAHWIKEHGVGGRSVWHGNKGRQPWNPAWGSMGYPTRTTVTVNKAPGNDAPAAANANARQTP